MAVVTVLPLMKTGNIPVHAMKAYRWSGGITYALDGNEFCNIAHQQLYTRRGNIRYQLDRRMGWPQSLPERLGERRRLLRVPGFEPFTAQPVA